VAVGATDAGTAKLYVSGNVGIGTTSPGSILEVASTGTADYLRLTNLTSGDILTVDSAGDLAVNTNQLYVDKSTGNVGIGTASPTSLLQVVSITNPTGINYLAEVHWEGDASTDAVPVAIRAYYKQTGSNSAGTGHSVPIWANGEDNVNNTFPFYVVEAKMDARSGQSVNYTGFLSFLEWKDPDPSNSNTRSGIMFGNYVTLKTFDNDGSTPRYEGTVVGYSMDNPVGGDYAVGIYIPDITGHPFGDYGIKIDGADSAALWLGAGADNTDPANGIIFGASEDVNLYRAGADKLKTDDDFEVWGSLGIHTTSPGSILEVASTGTADYLRLTNLTSGDILTVDSAGNVGIGISVPSEKLHLSDGTLLIDRPSSPALVGNYDTNAYIYKVYISGKYAYVANDTWGLRIVDISNPSSPVLVGSYNTSGNAWGVYVSGKYAYVADYGSGLQIIDISNPSSPALVGSYNTSGYARGVYVSGKYAYVADGGSGLQIIDISNPSSPSLVGSYDTSGNAWGVYVSGKYGSGLQIIDISNPSSPALVSNYDTSGNAYGVYISGKYAYVADDDAGLQIIDISNPSSADY